MCSSCFILKVGVGGPFVPFLLFKLCILLLIKSELFALLETDVLCQNDMYYLRVSHKAAVRIKYQTLWTKV